MVSLAADQIEGDRGSPPLAIARGNKRVVLFVNCVWQSTGSLSPRRSRFLHRMRLWFPQVRRSRTPELITILV